MTMAYQICEIRVGSFFEEEIVSLLNDLGAEGVSVEGDVLIADAVHEGRAEIWDEEQIHPENSDLIVKGFFGVEHFEDEKDQIIASLELFNLIHEKAADFRFYLLEDKVWQDKWKEYYKPFRVGDHLVIRPFGLDYDAAAEDIVIDIDPGLAFGTGNHPTTAGVLSLLEKTVKSGDVVLDCGCGTGILAVAAAKLGARSTYAADIDHDAILATVKNIRINHLFGKVEVFLRDVTKRPLWHLAPFDLVIANIVADVIIPLLPSVAPLLKKDAKLICGGIISDRFEEVENALTAYGFHIEKILREGDWVTLLAERND